MTRCIHGQNYLREYNYHDGIIGDQGSLLLISRLLKNSFSMVNIALFYEIRIRENKERSFEGQTK